MTQLLLGRPVADSLAEKIMGEAKNISPLKLATVGFCDPQWLQYTNSLKKSGERLGVFVENISLNTTSVHIFEDTVARICAQDDVCGVLLQQPLPQEFACVCKTFFPTKDVDCVSPVSRAKLYLGDNDVIFPATPSAVLKLLDFYRITVVGKHVVVVGRGNAVGKPLSQMLLRRNATVTVCHSKTENLAKITRSADIVISASGVANLITADCVTENSVVVDVGLSFQNGKTHGDVAEEVYQIARAVSPVPGGVGPITQMALFENLVYINGNKRYSTE